MKSKLLIIIPAYNEAGNIKEVVETLISNCPEYDFIIVNDRSRDQTAQICREHDYPMIDLPVNLGLSGSFQTGVKYAYNKGYERVIQFDGDGQHDSSYIKAVEKEMLQSGCDIVIGSRYIKKDKGIGLRVLGSRIISLCTYIVSHRWLTDPTSGMRMFSRRMMKEFIDNINYSPEPDTISYLISRGIHISEVPVVMHERMRGRSYLSPFNAAKYMLVTCFSILFVQWVRRKER